MGMYISNMRHIALSALNVAQGNLITTSNNVANVNTPGYSRQYNVLSPIVANHGFTTSINAFGQGVETVNIKRSFDQFVETEYLSASNLYQEAKQLYGKAQELDSIFSDNQTSLVGTLSDLFKAMGDLSSQPSSGALRSNLILVMRTLRDRFQSMDINLRNISSGINQEITLKGEEISSYTAQIAELNVKINQITRGDTVTNQPNDLLDQRDHLIQKLNEIIRVHRAVDSRNMVSLYMDNGSPLVMSEIPRVVTSAFSSFNSERVILQLGGDNDTLPVQLLDEKEVTGGSLGGLFEYRMQLLDTTRNSLGKLAIGITSMLNHQQNLGIDLNGDWGSNLFNLPLPSMRSSTLNAGTAELGIDMKNTDYDIQRIDGSVSTTHPFGYIVRRIPDGSEYLLDASNFVAGVNGEADLLYLDGGLKVSIKDSTIGDRYTVRPWLPSNQRIEQEATNARNPLSTDAAFKAELTSDYSNIAALSDDNYKITYLGGVNRIFLFQNLMTGDLYSGSDAGGSIEIAWGSLKNKLQELHLGFSLQFKQYLDETVTPPLLREDLSGLKEGDSFLVETLAKATRNWSVRITSPSEIATSLAFSPEPGATNQGAGRVSESKLVNNVSMPLQRYAVDANLKALNLQALRITYDKQTNSFSIAAIDKSGTVFDQSTLITPSASSDFEQFDAFKETLGKTIPYQSNRAVQIMGMSFMISGALADGDYFDFSPTVDAISDNRNLLRMSELETIPIMGEGRQTFASHYSMMISTVGEKTRQAQMTSTARENVFLEVEKTRNGISQVNLDEEAANLMRFQQHYQAAAKVLSVYDTLFETLLNLR